MEEYETTELSLASYLALQLEEMPSLEWSEDGTCAFVFTNVEHVVTFCVRFFAGGARVEPREYFFKTIDLRKKMNETRPAHLKQWHRSKGQ